MWHPLPTGQLLPQDRGADADRQAQLSPGQPRPPPHSAHRGTGQLAEPLVPSAGRDASGWPVAGEHGSVKQGLPHVAQDRQLSTSVLKR